MANSIAVSVGGVQHRRFVGIPLLVYFLVFLSHSTGVRATPIFVLNTANQLRVLNSATPETVSSAVTVTGLQVGESLLGIDHRPATGQLLGLGSTGRIYIINTISGAATAIGASPFGALSGTSFGFNVNPSADRIRVVSDTEQNLRVNPSTGGLTATDVSLAYGPSDIHLGANPNVVAVAYINSVAGAPVTLLYGIDTGFDTLVTINPPNNGTLNTVGSLGVNASAVCGFDISDLENTAFAAIAAPGSPSSTLYQINLATGAATSIGVIGGGSLIRAIAVVPTGTIQFSSALFTGSEQAGKGVVTLSRVGGTFGGMTVNFSTSPGAATPGVDYQPVSTPVTFAQGETTKIVEIPVFKDTVPELNETVNLLLSVSPGDGNVSGLTNAMLEIVSTTDLPVYLLTVSNRLVRISGSLSVIQTNIAITGLQANEVMLGIDFRPATGELFGLGSSNRLYKINTLTGAAALFGTPGAFTLSGADFGFDFNPMVDRIRVVSDTDQNIRLNPSTGGLAATDSLLSYGAGDANVGVNPNVTSVAYTRNFDGTTNTVLYGIDSSLNTLVIHTVPNGGVLNTVGSLGVDVSGVGGFDYTEADQAAYAVFNRTGSLSSEIYRIDLATGAARLLGVVGGGELIRDIAIPEPQPVLRIERVGGNAVISWTAASFGYGLESSASLTSPSWATVAPFPVLINDQKVVTNALTGAGWYYRLKK